MVANMLGKGEERPFERLDAGADLVTEDDGGMRVGCEAARAEDHGRGGWVDALDLEARARRGIALRILVEHEEDLVAFLERAFLWREAVAATLVAPARLGDRLDVHQPGEHFPLVDVVLHRKVPKAKVLPVGVLLLLAEIAEHRGEEGDGVVKLLPLPWERAGERVNHRPQLRLQLLDAL